MQRSPAGAGAAVQLEHVSKSYDGRRVLSDLSFEIEPGQFVAIVGRSGSGKSTLLRLLCGLEEPNGGSARVLDRQGRDARTGVRVVFQEPRLLPWKSVLENVTLGIPARDAAARKERQATGYGVLSAVGLADRAHEYPGVLSGGQRQRVALARALLHDPSVMLLDEPFGALDALTRIEAQQLLESLWLERHFTALLVTHDVNEAVLLADRVLLVEEGAIAAAFEVTVARPRRRDSEKLARIAGAVLERIFASPASAGSGSRARSAERAAEGQQIAAISSAGRKPAHV